eukprot:10338429-Heterocapsa_arctica.AAC.1
MITEALDLIDTSSNIVDDRARVFAERGRWERRYSYVNLMARTIAPNDPEMPLGERLLNPDRRALRQNLSQRISEFVATGEYGDATNDTGLERLVRLWEDHSLLAELKRLPLTPRLGEAVATVARYVICDG